MARPLRIEYPGALYHVTCRGNARGKIFLIDSDRELFLQVLTQAVERFNWLCHAYCQMTNHYHLLIETVDPTLARGMRQLNGVYTQEFNRRHSRTGHVFQGRYKAILVERDAYLLELARYVVLNPVRAKMGRTAKDWPWSSYRATAGFEDAPLFLTTDWILEQFGPSQKKAQAAYRKFVSAGRRVTVWENLRGQIYLGSDAFIEQHAPSGSASLPEIPRVQRLVDRPTLDAVVTSSKDAAGVAKAYLEHGYTMNEIAAHLDVHYSTVSRRLRQYKAGQDHTECMIARPDPPVHTERQGQFLAYIHQYSVLNGCAPAEADMERFFQTTPPSVHSMVLTLERRGLIRRVPRQARSITLSIPPESLPPLKPRPSRPSKP
jgi:REP element-mobilizing transposase RayT/DNA-binding MarR family transcriptional regulator